MDKLARLDDLCICTIRTLAIDAIQKADSGHPGAPLGMAPVMYVLWDRLLQHDPACPQFPNRDRFVLSMGHASMLLYATMHLTGYHVSLDDLRDFRQLHGKCAGHPESTLIPGVETTTGPLGQGIGNSVGMAIAERWLAAYFNRPGHTLVDHTVYAMCSDGDLMEGVGSEAASLAGHLGLNNLIWIYDNNGITIDGQTNITFSENVAGRFQSYGWFVQHVRDANNLDEIFVALEAARAEANRPALIVVDSRIGYGSPNRAGTSKAHGEPLGEAEVRLTKQSLGWDPDLHFHVPEEVTRHMTDRAKRHGADLSADWRRRFGAYATEFPDLARQWESMQAGELPVGWDENLPVFEADPKGLATRIAGSKAIAAIAAKIPWLIGGAADLAASTKTVVPDSGLFSRENPAGRNIAFGIREHAMAAVVNGLVLSKLRAFGSTFLTFADYCRPAIRLAAMSHLPAIFVFTHDSVGLGEDGPTHQPIEHLASLRAMPNLDVIRPCDANETSAAWRYVMSVKDRPTALALTRQAVPTFDRTRYASADGLLQGAYVLLDCPGTPDVILIGTGSEVQRCVAAADRLAAEGIAARVVSMPCWEQFNRQPWAYHDSVLPPGVRARVSIEAGATMGWSRYVRDAGIAIGIDRFGLSAPDEDVMKELGITADAVVEAARRILQHLGSNSPNAHGHSPESKVRPPRTPGASDPSRDRQGAVLPAPAPHMNLDAAQSRELPATRLNDGGDQRITRIQRIAALDQSIWCDCISRSMIESGELARMIDAGVVGLTSNPTIFQKAISQGAEYDDTIQSLVADGKNAAEIYEALTLRDIAAAANLLRPIYDRTDGRDGFVSLEVNPHLADDTAGTVAEAEALFRKLDRPNVFIKVPATEAGIPAIETLIGEGINVNVTLIFALNMYDKVMRAYIRGVERFAERGGDVSRVASVASFFVSRVDTLVDARLQERIERGETGLTDLLGKAAVANAKLAYVQFETVFRGEPFAALAAKGARVQRPLWASTSTKNPAYVDTIYVDTLIGPDTVNTLPPQTIEAVLDHGQCSVTIDHDLAANSAAVERLAEVGINMGDVTDELLRAGVKAFADSFDRLMTDIHAKLAAFQAV